MQVKFCAILILLINSIGLFSKPYTIPPLREWSDAEGQFVFTKGCQIIVDSKYSDDLSSTAETFIEDLTALTSYQLKTLQTISAVKGEIFLTLGANDLSIGDEGYFLNIDDKITITANTAKGVFYGTRSVLQMLKQSDTINAGFAKDMPLMKERSLFIDNGRKYFTIEWLENHIKDISYLKMNYLDFYLSDNNDFRLECEQYPDVTSEIHYTKADIKHLVEFAKKYHVTIVPCINMPGHMGALLKPYVEQYSLKDKYGGFSTTFLDITQPSARNFAKNLIEEYIDLFDSPFWHLGADEYNYLYYESYPQFEEYAKSKYGDKAKPLDAFFDFVNWANEIVKSHGKTMRIFNDAMSIKHSTNLDNIVEVSKDIIIDYWEGADQPQRYIDEGYQICNSSSNFLYYNIGSPWKIHTVFIYETWEINQFEGKKPVTMLDNNHLGAKFFVWCNTPNLETESHIAQEIRHTLRALSTRIWGGDKPMERYIDFVKLGDDIGRSPGVKYPTNPMPGNLAFGKNAFASSTSVDSIYQPSFINDASYNSDWKSMPGQNEWIYIDLEDTMSISEVKLIWFFDNPDVYELQTSNNKADWQTVFRDETGTGRVIYANPDSAAGRYLRVLFSGSPSQEGYNLWELEVYGEIYKKPDDDSTITSFPVKEKSSSYLNIFPNPTSDKIKVDFKIDTTCNVKIFLYDTNGNKLDKLLDSNENQGIHQIKYDCSNLSSGEYLILMNCEDIIRTNRFLIVK